jgi:hypothetical protein
MSDQAKDKAGPESTSDPFEAWRKMRDAGMDAWAKTMVEYVNSDTYSQFSGQMLDAYLTGSAPFRSMVEKTMIRALEQLSLPSRADFVSLAERLTNIEMRLDDIDAKLDQLLASRTDAPPVRKPKEGRS